MTSRIREAVALVRRLYTLPRCYAGGPLHVELDDGNLDVDQFDMSPMYVIPERRSSSGSVIRGHPDDWSPEVHDVCDRIHAVMGPMTEYRRRVVRRLALPR